ncbi:MAG: DUF3795 domain-containing protein [Candidatus Hodarchaeota archaeon]
MGLSNKINLDLLAFCGIYSGSCPSYLKGTCLGCRSDSREQKRTSKWGCKIRKCVHENKGLLHCGQCDEFPCKIFEKKLLKNHEDDPRFAYRFQTPANFERIKEVGENAWLAEQEQLWSCPDCDGTVAFYECICNKCGKARNPQVPEDER